MPCLFSEELLLYWNIFITLSWFCIQQALGYENQVWCLRVTANLPIRAQVPQIRKYGATPIFYEIIVLYKYIYNHLMILHPTSPCWLNLGQYFRVTANLPFFGLNAPNERKYDAMPFFRGTIILQSIYDSLMIQHPTSSWLGKSDQVF